MTDALSLLKRPAPSDRPIIRNRPKIGEATVRKPVPGRTCGTCTLCCKLYPVPVMDKPAYAWCRECKPGKGCGIWETRPQFCRDVHCHYILDAGVGDDWRPDKAKFIMNFQSANVLRLKVDPAHRDAWKREPYYSLLKRWSADFIAAGGFIVVDEGLQLVCVTPANDVVVSRKGQFIRFHVKTCKVGQTVTYEVVIEPSESGNPSSPGARLGCEPLGGWEVSGSLP